MLKSGLFLRSSKKGVMVMNVAVINVKEKSFLANNNRWYRLLRTDRAAPAPKIFSKKKDAKDATLKYGVSDDPKTYLLVKPENVKQIWARRAVIRKSRITCGGRR